MLKTEAIQLLGGTHQAAAEAIGVTTQAIYGWPDPLSQKLHDRVLAAVYRKHAGLPAPIPEKRGPRKRSPGAKTLSRAKARRKSA